MSEREELYITARYYRGSGQIEKAIQAFELCKRTYPRDPASVGMLGNLYDTLGQFDKALE